MVLTDGRMVFDAGNGSAMTWDSKYAGYEANSNNAAMQVQGGG